MSAAARWPGWEGNAATAAVLVAVAVSVATASAGCGARTGLEVPDAARRDPEEAGVGRDAGPDASTDAGADAATMPRCIEAPPDGDPVAASFTLPVSLAVVDLMFLLDGSGSMTDEIGTIRNRLRDRVVPGVRDAIPDAAFGVAFLGEFPEPPHGPSTVRPYELRAPITRDVLRVAAALESAPTWGNRDEPEAQVEALYQVMTGEGLEPWITPAGGCPRGGTGGGCFRNDALPVVMLVTDAPFHNGPPDVEPFAPYSFTPAPHDYEDAVEAVTARDAVVLGLGATDFGALTPMNHLRALARDTGSVDSGGEPLAFNIGAGGGGIGDSVVRAIEQLASGFPLDVDAVVRDDPRDAVDARMLVQSVRPTAAMPEEGIERREMDRFVGVQPGTRVTFEIAVDGAALDDRGETARIPARVVFRAFGRSQLGSRRIEIVVPGEDGEGCS